MCEIIIPEEALTDAVYKALTEYFPKLVAEKNKEWNRLWIKPFATVLKSHENYDLHPLPLVEMKLERVKRKSSDPFVELVEFELVLECRYEFDWDTPFRYTWLLKEMFRSDEAINSIIDRYVIEECVFRSVTPRGGIGFPESTYTIRLYRDQII